MPIMRSPDNGASAALAAARGDVKNYGRITVPVIHALERRGINPAELERRLLDNKETGV